MRKIIMLWLVIISGTAYGYTTCMRNNTYLGIFKKNVDGTSSTYENSTKVWKVIYDYITLTGYASCNEISGTANTPKTNLVTGAADQGIYCWCQMWPIEYYGYETGPSSYWIYLDSYASESACASGCTSACATAMKDDDTFRTAVFESMW